MADSDKEKLAALAALPGAAVVGDIESVPPPEEAPLNAVIVMRNIDDNGNLTTPITLNGDVKVTEIETILKLAIKNIRQSLGVE